MRDGARCGVIRVALFSASVERLLVRRHQRPVEEQPYHQVGIGNEGLSESNQVSAPASKRLFGPQLVEFF